MESRRYGFEAKQEIRTSPAVVDGVVYVGDSNGLIGGSGDEGVFYAIDAATGVERSRFSVGSDIYSSAAVMDGAVYFGSEDGYLSVDAVEGTLRWRFAVEFDGVVSAPAVVDGVVYFGGDRSLYAADGSERWRYTTELNEYDEVVKITSSPSVADGVVYFGSMDSDLYAVNASISRYKRFAW